MIASAPAILFRSDASATIGTGHVMRCLTLSVELTGRRWRVAIAGRMPDGLATLTREAGVDIHELPDGLAPADEPAWLDAAGILDGVDLVVSDLYDLDAAWERAVGAQGRVVAAIDDLAARPMAVDLVVNQNLGATPERYAGLVPSGATVLTGPRYALVRPAFARIAATMPPRTGDVRRILVFMSGADEHDVTARAAEAAAAEGLPVDVVVGSAYKFADRLATWAAAHPTVRIHVDTPRMAELMAAADLAIGAPSSASWERCTLGLPAILVILAENQVEVGALLHAAGAARTLGWYHLVTTDEISDAVAGLCSDPPSLLAMGAAAAAITDGLGASRTADVLEALVAARSTSRAS